MVRPRFEAEMGPWTEDFDSFSSEELPSSCWIPATVQDDDFAQVVLETIIEKALQKVDISRYPKQYCLLLSNLSHKKLLDMDIFQKFPSGGMLNTQ